MAKPKTNLNLVEFVIMSFMSVLGPLTAPILIVWNVFKFKFSIGSFLWPILPLGQTVRLLWRVKKGELKIQ